MTKLINFLPYLLIVLPILSTVIIYQIRFNVVGNQWKAIHTAVQLSAIFYVAAVVSLFKLLFGSYFIGYTLILLICVLAGLLIWQWKKEMEVVFLKGLKFLSRIIFLSFFIGYIFLLVYWAVDYFYLST